MFPPSTSMSSAPAPMGQKRHLKYACDRCRGKKIGCNSPIIGGTDTTVGPRLNVQNSCSNCVAANEPCTYGFLPTRKAIPKKYVMSLEDHWDSLTWLIPQIFPPTYLKGNPEFLKGTEVSNTPTSRNPAVWPLFPPEDLYRKLVNIYFSHINIFWPLFHYPTFQDDLTKGRHRFDLGFAQVLLGICAIASRYSSDSRALAKVPRELQAESTSPEHMRSAWVDDLEGTRAEKQFLVDASRDSAGWKYYNRICNYHTATTTEITLTELQTAHLIYQFLLGMSDRKAGSVVLGAALRRAQAKGLHRNKNTTIDFENELWKRAYWCLVVAERMMALETSQALLSLEQNIEVDLPLEIDDEAWGTSPTAVRRLGASDPDNHPSVLAIFNHYARFSSEFEKLIKKSSKLPLTQEELANEFIQPYREWLAKTPRHLRIDNVGLHAANPIWEAQSKVLYMMYGFFGVCLCAISMQETETLFVDEVLKLVSEIFVSVNASGLTDTNTCRLCPNEHSSIYLRAKWRSSIQTIPDAEEGSFKEAFYNDIIDTCWNILTALRESWMTAQKSLALIEHFTNSTEEELLSEVGSGESHE